MLGTAAAPHSSACVYDREAELARDFVAFDQTEGLGWRPLYDSGCYREAAELLRDWRAAHPDAFDPEDRRDQMFARILTWHEAQMWAFGGRFETAEPLFEGSYRATEMGRPDPWNLYVGGTLAFLRRDRPALTTAMAALATIPKPPGWDRAVGADGKPVSLLWPQNLNVLQGLDRC